MTYQSRSLLSGILLVAFLGLNSWLPFQATRHSQAHAHHQATTHASPLCSWLCAAGHISYAEGQQIPRPTSFTIFIDKQPFQGRHALFTAAPLSRGPPQVPLLLS